MNKTTKDNIRILIIGVLGFLISLSLTSCGTTSGMRCDNKVGYEKEYCQENYKNQVRQMDYMQFRAGFNRQNVLEYR